MKIKILSLLFITAFTTFGCESANNITGKLSLSKRVTILTPGGNKATLEKGNYTTTLQFQQGTSMAFIKANGTTVQLKIPRAAADKYGKIEISAKEMQQSFGISGAITQSSRPFSRHVEEECIYSYRTERVCNSNNECEWREIAIPGRQTVYEEGEAVTKNISLNLVSGRSSVGKFSGSYQLGETIDRRELIGYCERSHW
ncbi:MAG: hypothetical protein M9962_06250 [Oligoflexia bacterium]|nr:hypothetical protein [Oligoflexia bacterium]